MASLPSTQTWLITGCSSGFGLLLARTALAHGHNVIATSRNPSKSPEIVNEIKSNSRGRWLALDVCWPADKIRSAVAEAAKAFGQDRIDVLVNNAGYSILGAAEDIPEDEAKAEFETNFWGPVRLTKAVLPLMRAQKTGTVVNITSVAGITVLPTASMYAASKFALEAYSEGMAQEVAPQGIRVLIVEPGAFRTNFLTADAMQTVPPSEPYKGGVVSQVLGKFDDMNGTQKGDTIKAAQRIYEVVNRKLPAEQLGKIETLRLLLGMDCYDRVTTRLKQLNENVEAAKGDAMNLEHAS